jgi:hypothetical protein
MKTKKKIVVMTGFVMVLFFMTVSVFAETKPLGPKKIYGIEFPSCVEYINESWVPGYSSGATLMTHYMGLNFLTRDSALMTASLLMGMMLKEKTLCNADLREEKWNIDKKETIPFRLVVRECDNGEIFVEILDVKTGRNERWIFK